jgi:hypothetical protein
MLHVGERSSGDCPRHLDWRKIPQLQPSSR